MVGRRISGPGAGQGVAHQAANPAAAHDWRERMGVEPTTAYGA